MQNNILHKLIFGNDKGPELFRAFTLCANLRALQRRQDRAPHVEGCGDAFRLCGLLYALLESSGRVKANLVCMDGVILLCRTSLCFRSSHNITSNLLFTLYARRIEKSIKKISSAGIDMRPTECYYLGVG